MTAESFLPDLMSPKPPASPAFLRSRSSRLGGGDLVPAGAQTLTMLSLIVPDAARRYASPNRLKTWTAKCCSMPSAVIPNLPLGGPPRRRLSQ
jgi:hypothetical protein